MSITDLKREIGDFAKDIRVNLGNLFDEESELTKSQIYTTALACAYSVKSDKISDAIKAEYNFEENEIEAAKSAASIMAMNNIYYRFIHLSSDSDFAKLPANLRMTVIGKPGVDRVDFELYSLAISAINGCGMCIDAHVNELNKHISKKAIQNSIRIAAIINAADTALNIK